MRREIERWEGEGGAIRIGSIMGTLRLRGTQNQVEWAERIRRSVNAEFDRVTKALVSATSKQSPDNQRDAEAVIAILEEKRAQVMANDRAGYFIQDWQEMGGRVRQMIIEDPRYAAMKAKRDRRRVAVAVCHPAT